MARPRAGAVGHEGARGDERAPLGRARRGGGPGGAACARCWRRARRVALGVALALAPLGALRALRERGILLNRPARVWRERQLLVVGFMGSGTRQTVRELGRLGLELAHEGSGGVHGSVSWLHALRYLEDPAGPNASTLCARPSAAMAWHPGLLEPGHCPGSGRTGGWDACWDAKCGGVLERQYGCELHAHAHRARCLPRYRRTLLQVRHPLRTLASCARAFCAAGDARAPAATAPLLRTARALLPSLGAWAQPPPRAAAPPCAGAFAALWVELHAAMLRALPEAGWYRVEDTPPCALARRAGFLDAGGPFARSEPAAHASAAAACAAAPPAAPPARAARAQPHGEVNRHNVDGLALTYADVEALAGREVRERMEALARAFGYDDGAGPAAAA